MKRLCFDTQSNYHRPPLAGFSENIEPHRAVMEKEVVSRPIRFDCAVVFDEVTESYSEFGPTQAMEVIALLATASELISQNGRRCDLVVLEQVCGRNHVAPLWEIPHYDLIEKVPGFVNLNALSEHYLSNEYLSALKRDYEARIDERDRRWPRESNESFIATKLAQARFDVARSYAVFRAIETRVKPTARTATQQAAKKGH